MIRFSPLSAPLLAGSAALIISFILISLKGTAFILTSSTIILASLVDSIADFTISLLNFFAIRHAQKPADQDHRYGHGKIEGLASVFQASLIAGAGFFILLEAMERLVNPTPLNLHFLAISVIAFSLLLTIALVVIQTRLLKVSYSLAVEADRSHYTGDIAVNLGIIIVLFADYSGAPAWIDPLGAIAVMAYMSLNAWQIGQKGLDMLMDREAGGNTRERILETVLSHKQIYGMHDLRTRYNGNTLHIAFDVEMKADLLLCQAHAAVKDIEEKLLAEFPDAEIMIHKDPIGETDDSRHTVKGVHV